MQRMRDLLLLRLTHTLGGPDSHTNRVRINGGLEKNMETLPNTLSIGRVGAFSIGGYPFPA